MIDETDPVVRAIQAPFETTMGEFYRRVKDANAAYHEEVDKIEKESAKLDEERELILSGRAKEAEQDKAEQPAQDFDYDRPLAERETGPRRWPGAPQSAPVHQEPVQDEEDEAAARLHRLRHASWTQSAPEPEPAPPAWSAPPAPRVSPRNTRRVEHDDEDYSNESWLQ